MRIASLLPSATEILWALGLGDDVVGVTHECDWPVEAAGRPHLTFSHIPGGLSAKAIDGAVRASLTDDGSLYGIDADRWQAARPELVVTQELCEVCAVSGALVAQAAATLDPPPAIINLEPHTLDDVLATILAVGRATGTADRADTLVAALHDRRAAIAAAVATAPPPPAQDPGAGGGTGAEPVRVVCVEWTDPVYLAGHWVPEQVALAGGVELLGTPGRDSRRSSWDEVAAALPDLVVLMPCGYDLARTREEALGLFAHLPASAIAVDASAYFSRPGPRLLEGAAALAEAFHPGLRLGAPARSWARVA